MNDSPKNAKSEEGIEEVLASIRSTVIDGPASMPPPDDDVASEGNRTVLDQLALEALTPVLEDWMQTHFPSMIEDFLRDWLTRNLPQTVGQIVRSEIIAMLMHYYGTDRQPASQTEQKSTSSSEHKN